jgi:hypothetical protein
MTIVTQMVYRHQFRLVITTGAKRVTSSVSGKSMPVWGVRYRRVESNGGALDLRGHSGYVALSLGAAECVGSHFWLSCPQDGSKSPLCDLPSWRCRTRVRIAMVP